MKWRELAKGNGVERTGFFVYRSAAQIPYLVNALFYVILWARHFFIFPLYSPPPSLSISLFHTTECFKLLLLVKPNLSCFGRARGQLLSLDLCSRFFFKYTTIFFSNHSSSFILSFFIFLPILFYFLSLFSFFFFFFSFHNPPPLFLGYLWVIVGLFY